LLQIYQGVSSFFQSIVEYLSNYFGSLFEDKQWWVNNYPRKFRRKFPVLQVQVWKRFTIYMIF
jgi:hypothetical protein